MNHPPPTAMLSIVCTTWMVYATLVPRLSSALARERLRNVLLGVRRLADANLVEAIFTELEDGDLPIRRESST